MFQSASFWIFLALSVPLFWGLPKRLRFGFLTLASMAYLGLLVHRDEETLCNALALLGWALLFYYLAPLTVRVARRAWAPAVAGTPKGGGTLLDDATPPPPRNPAYPRVVFWFLVGSILIYLCWFKYVHPAGEAGLPVIPLGISYFTFKFIHYVIEVARGNVKDRSLGQFFSYIFLFPIFSQGPIERFDHYLANQQQRLRRDDVVQGLMRIVYGLIKKCVMAEMLFGDLFAHVRGGQFMRELPGCTGGKVWSMAMAINLYEYFDFAGYTDIAIGASQLFGLKIMENFNWPILAPNISVFWKRWHMTLTGWCITYIYMPVMGWTRRPNLATYVTFIVMAAWHAFSKMWIFWGLYQATGLVVYQAWARLKRRQKWNWLDTGNRRWIGLVLGIAATFLFVSAGELITFSGINEAHFFESKSLHDLGVIGGKLIFINVH